MKRDDYHQTRAGKDVNGSGGETHGRSERTYDVILDSSGRSDLIELGLSLTSFDNEGAKAEFGGRSAGKVQRVEYGEEREEGKAVVVDGRVVGEVKGSEGRRERDETGDSLDGRLRCVEVKLEEAEGR
jgi:hypothetical protein